jgi:hypothetical protein
MSLPKLPRMTLLAVVSIILFIACQVLQEHAPGSLLAVTIYKAHMAGIAGWLGYWIDRGLFPYSRPHELLDQAEDAHIHGTPNRPLAEEPTEYLIADHFGNYNQATLRRAIIVAACIIGICLGA